MTVRSLPVAPDVRFGVYPDDAVFEWRGPDGIVHRDSARSVPPDEDVVVLGQCAVFSLEDKKQMDQLWRILNTRPDQSVVSEGNREWTRNVLRKFLMPAVPPPIEEPTTLGTIVEDDEGEGWVLVNNMSGHRVWRRLTSNGTRFWPGVHAVKVHTDGFTPTGADA